MNKTFIALACVVFSLTACKEDKKIDCKQPVYVFESYVKTTNGNKNLVYDFDQLKMWSIDTSINYAIKKEDAFSKVTSHVLFNGKSTFTSEFKFKPLPHSYLKLDDDNKTNQFIQSQDFGENAQIIFHLSKEDGSYCEASYPIYR